MIKPVSVTPEAEAQVRASDAWWRAERPMAPDMFLNELAEAFEMIRHFAGAGQRVPRGNVAGVRRVLLRASRFHVYYVEGAEVVDVLAVWSAVRGRGPQLGAL